MKNHNKKIVIVEDNPADMHLTKLAFGEMGLANQLLHFADGELILEYLRVSDLRDIRYILLDLNLPGMTGFDILLNMKYNIPDFDLPVVIFTTSNNIDDINKAYDLGVNVYLTKPLDINEYFNTIQGVSDFYSVKNIYELKTPN